MGYFLDQFNAPAGTTLEAYGNGWSRSPSGGELTISKPGEIYAGGTGTQYANSATLAASDPVFLNFHFYGDASNIIGLYFNMPSATDSGNCVRVNSNGQGSQTLEWYTFNSGTPAYHTSSSVSPSLQPGHDYQVKVDRSKAPTTYLCTLTDLTSATQVATFNAADSTYTSGLIGLRIDPQSASGGFHVTAIQGGLAPTVTGITVSPATATVSGSATQQFTATVSGTNSPAQTVTWTTSAGSITASGLLTVPAAANSAQSITVTATSTVDSTKSSTATVTVPAATPPTIGAISVTSGDGVDVITYPAPTPGSRAILAVSLLVGKTAGGEAATPVAVNIGGSTGSFLFPSGSYRYTVIVTDAGSPALISVPSNEIAGAVAPRGLPTTVAQTTAIVRNILSTFFTPSLLAGLAKLSANVLEVDVLSIAGSTTAASGLRDGTLNQATSQANLNAFGAVVATQLQSQFNTTLPPALLTGLAKLESATLDVNVVSFAGSTTAVNNLRDEELNQTISTSAVTAISSATAQRLTIPSATDTATAVWNNATRTLTPSPTS